MFEVFHNETYTRGLNVTTTLRKDEQEVAYAALRKQVLDYDRKYGYRGPEAFIELGDDPNIREQRIEDALVEAIESPNLLPAVVLEVAQGSVRVVVQGGGTLEIKGEGLKFVAPSLSPKAQPNRKIVPGAVVRLARTDKGVWEIAQLPQVEAAFVAASAKNGAVRALVGGFDFNLNKFNHVTQAWRQPGSSFKPFIYSASLEKGFMPSTLINDAPISIDPALTGGQAWEPKNYDGKFEGPMRLRQGLAKSKNLVSIRILQAIGPGFARDWVTRFGFEADKHPAYLTMALGAGSVTPWQMLSAYGVFANGGYHVNPYIISKITDSTGKVLMEGQAADRRRRSQPGARRTQRLRDGQPDEGCRPLRHGGARMSLKRSDIAGKTGTTNDSHDAWFAGYGGDLVAVSWLGFDQPRPLGERETGGGLALPIWISYMAKALSGVPEAQREMPPGVVQLGGEVYFAEHQPGQGIASVGVEETHAGRGKGAARDGARSDFLSAVRQARARRLRRLAPTRAGTGPRTAPSRRACRPMRHPATRNETRRCGLRPTSAASAPGC